MPEGTGPGLSQNNQLCLNWEQVPAGFASLQAHGGSKGRWAQELIPNGPDRGSWYSVLKRSDTVGYFFVLRLVWCIWGEYTGPESISSEIVGLTFLLDVVDSTHARKTSSWSCGCHGPPLVLLQPEVHFGLCGRSYTGRRDLGKYAWLIFRLTPQFSQVSIWHLFDLGVYFRWEV